MKEMDKGNGFLGAVVGRMGEGLKVNGDAQRMAFLKSLCGRLEVMDASGRSDTELLRGVVGKFAERIGIDG